MLIRWHSTWSEAAEAANPRVEPLVCGFVCGTPWAAYVGIYASKHRCTDAIDARPNRCRHGSWRVEVRVTESNRVDSQSLRLVRTEVREINGFSTRMLIQPALEGRQVLTPVERTIDEQPVRHFRTTRERIEVRQIIRPNRPRRAEVNADQ